MNRLTIKELKHDGTNCHIYKIANNSTYEPLIMKQLKRKFYNWKDIIGIREIDALRKVVDPSVIKLKEVIKDNDKLNLVFEEMECNLQQFIDRNEESGAKLTEAFIRA